MSYQTALIGRVIGENSEGDCKAVAAFLILFLKRGSEASPTYCLPWPMWCPLEEESNIE